MNITSEPDVTTALASEDDLAELEDVLVARLTRYGVVDARTLCVILGQYGRRNA